MNIIQEKLVNSYTVLVMAERMTLEQVPEANLIGGTDYPIRNEVEILIALKTIEALG